MKQITALIAALAIMTVAACTKTEEPVEKEDLTVKERAERVGTVADKVYGTHVKEDLTKIIDENDARLKEMEEAGK